MTTLQLLAGAGAVIRQDNLVVLAVGEVEGDTVEAIRSAAATTDPDAGFGSVVKCIQSADLDGGAVVLLERQGAAELWATGHVRVVTQSDEHDAATHLAGLSLRLPLQTLRSIASTSASTEPGWQSIESGAASAAGFVLATPGTEAPVPDEAPPAEPVVPSEPFVAVSLTEPIDLSEQQPLPTAEVGDDANDANDANDEDLPPYAAPRTVLGVLSPGGYFNHPEARYCSRTGVKMGASATKALTEGIRPPLGVLTFDNGSTYSVQYDTIIGREPETDERVIGGDAAALSVVGDNQEVSRRHLLLELIDWDVFITDLDTANGTHIRESTAHEVRRLVPGQRTALPGGAEVFIGTTRFQYHEHHVR